MPRSTRPPTTPALSVPPLPPLSTAPPGATMVGVIDLGSNSVRLVVAEVMPGTAPRIIMEEREPVRLGEAVFATGLLNPAAAERTLTALKRFAALARARGVTRVHARGTCALREAEDRESFLARVHDETGVEVRVLTGAEEARLIARGVLTGLPDTSGEWVLVDVGGGSVEVCRAVEGTLTDAASLKLGAVRLAEMYLRSDPPSHAELDLLRAHARSTLRGVVSFQVRPNGRVVGSAGTINALVQVARVGKNPSATVTVEDLHDTVMDLARMPLAKRRNVPGLEPRRADIIVAGGLALVETLRHVGARTLDVSRRGLKEGLLLEAVETLGMTLPAATEPERLRVDGALGIARRYQADEAHASQVAALACKLFEALRSVHQLGDDARSELEVAALLHDIGSFVSFERHHRHTAYLVANTPLPGFSPEAITRIAAITRYHRRGTPKNAHPEWAALPRADRERVMPLCAILRVADALDRTHHHVVQDLNVQVHRKEVWITLRTTGPADMECWAAAEKADLFEESFERALRVMVEDAPAPTAKKRARA